MKNVALIHSREDDIIVPAFTDLNSEMTDKYVITIMRGEFF